MSCNALTDIEKGCENNQGGIKRFWVVPFADVDVATEAVTGDGILTTITLSSISPAADFVEYYLPKNTASFVEDSVTSQASEGIVHTVVTTLSLKRREVAKRNSLALLASGYQFLFIIMEDANGLFWAQGWKNGSDLTSIGEGSGVAKADGSKYSVVITSEEAQMMPEVASALMSSLGLI